MRLAELYIEDQIRPLGLDEQQPRFSWIYEDAQRGDRQAFYRIQVIQQPQGTLVWDSRECDGADMSGIAYDGASLRPCTRYRVILTIGDTQGATRSLESWFETGLMNPAMEAWEGAAWIAAPRYTVCNRTRGVYRIESTLRMEDGARHAGIVFGANDERLLDSALNEYRIAGDNYIRYEIDASDMEHICLAIYRVGYAPEDRASVPLVRIALPMLHGDNLYDWHTLRVEVTGNNALAYIDGEPAGGTVSLNPRGCNDVLTYPRLHEIGFYAGEQGRVRFRNLTVSNIREPGATVIDERPQGNLLGGRSVFADRMQTEDDGYVLSGGQVVADTSNTGLPMLRRDLALEEQPARARLYITSRGIYSCRINGRPLTEDLLTPGLSQYDKRLHYRTYDVTAILHRGSNAIGVILSSGWWSDAQTFTVCNYNYFGDKEALLCKLVLEYADGRREVVVSDTEHWQYSGDGPYEYAGLYMGEQYNAQNRTTLEVFSTADYDASAWEHPVVYEPQAIPPYDVGFQRPWPGVNETQPLLVGGYDAPVRVVETRRPVCRTQVQEGVWLYDFGQEMAGVPRVTFHEAAGTRVYLQYGEMCYPDLPAYQGNVGRLMRENYRDAESTDIYVCRGEAQGETYQPLFTFHGFRYLEIHGVENPPALEEVQALQYSSVTEFVGGFTCSNPLVNRFVQNVRWSQLCNFISIPTDCPQRNERMGWAGDTHVFCSTALHNSNLKLFYERNLQAFDDLQEENGRYPEIAPIGGGFGGITYECAPIFIAWELYQQYGDLRVLERYYPSFQRYMHYMEHAGLPGHGVEELVGPLADWLAFEDTDAQLMWNAFYYRELSLMERIAHVLGHADDRAVYEAGRRACKAYWNQTFVRADLERTCSESGAVCDTQTSYALAIVYEVADDPQMMARQLARRVRESDYKVGTGFFGTGLINRALSQYGYHEEAYRMLLQEQFPSWLYPVTQGATSIWEHWDSYTTENGFGEYNAMNSFNHYSLGSVVSWLYEYVLGIRRMEEYPGYRRFLLEPVVGDLDYARGQVASPRGIIASGWERTEQGIRYTCRIPANTGALLVLPDGRQYELTSGEYTFDVKK